MKVWGIPLTALEEVASQLGFQLYDLRPVGRALQFTLRPADRAGDRYRRLSPSAFPTKSGNPRRIWAVCYHGHWRFMETVLMAYPAGRIKTAQADYRGLDSFHQLAPAVGDRNIGSMMHPMAMREACTC